MRRPGHHLRRPEGHAGRLRPRLLRTRDPHALPAQLLPLRRARGRGRHLLHPVRRKRSARGEAVRRLQGDRLAGGPRGGHGPPEGAGERRARPRARSPASPSASGWSGSPCSATASTTFASSSRTTSASSTSSRGRGGRHTTMRISLQWLSRARRPPARGGAGAPAHGGGPRGGGHRAARRGARRRGGGAHPRLGAAPQRRQALGGVGRRGRRAAAGRLRGAELQGGRPRAPRHGGHRAAGRRAHRARPAPGVESEGMLCSAKELGPRRRRERPPHPSGRRAARGAARRGARPTTTSSSR